MYIIRPTVEEEARIALINEINEIFVKNKSTVTKVTEWGMRDLAYEVADFRKGYYVLLNVDATPEAVAEFNRVANIKEDVIRNIIVAE
jgi:small subunit ribosomal protein S6